MQVTLTLKIAPADAENPKLRDVFSRCAEEVLDVAEFSHTVLGAIASPGKRAASKKGAKKKR